jgi:hypothetical protein
MQVQYTLMLHLVHAMAAVVTVRVVVMDVMGAARLDVVGVVNLEGVLLRQDECKFSRIL